MAEFLQKITGLIEYINKKNNNGGNFNIYMYRKGG